MKYACLSVSLFQNSQLSTCFGNVRNSHINIFSVKYKSEDIRLFICYVTLVMCTKCSGGEPNNNTTTQTNKQTNKQTEKNTPPLSDVWLFYSTYYNLFQFPEQEITVLATSSKPRSHL